MSWIFVMDLGVLLWLQKALHPPNKGHPCSLKSTCDPPSQQSGCGALEFSSQMSACTGRQPRPNTRMLCALRPTIVKKKGNQTHHKSHPTYCLLCYDIRSIQQQKKQKHNGKYNHLATSSSNTTSIKKKNDEGAKQQAQTNINILNPQDPPSSLIRARILFSAHTRLYDGMR